MDDPFFPAHAQRTNLEGVFYADCETTALGRVELFDICLASDGPDLCYNRGEVRQHLEDITGGARKRQETEWIALLLRASGFFSLGYNLCGFGLSHAKSSLGVGE
jgi:hypothetical protein